MTPSSYTLQTSDAPGWDDRAWDAFVEAHPRGHFLQLSDWGRFKEGFGWESLRVGWNRDGQWGAGAQILFRPLLPWPWGPRLAYIPKGPLVDWEAQEATREFLQALHKLARRRGAVVLRVEPELPDTPQARAWLQKAGFSPAPRGVQPRTTVWVDLTLDEDAILARMKQKWRYNIRLAARKGVVIRVGEARDLDAFVALMQETGTRKAFGVHTGAYYRQFWQRFAASGRAVLLVAEYQGEVLAGIMVGRSGPYAYYFYGASGNRGRHLMPNHRLQWEAMRWAKSQGCVAYDLWGVPDEVGQNPDAPIPDPPVGMWGVWRFKRGFGGRIVRYVGAWDRAYYPLVLRALRRWA